MGAAAVVQTSTGQAGGVFFISHRCLSVVSDSRCILNRCYGCQEPGGELLRWRREDGRPGLWVPTDSQTVRRSRDGGGAGVCFHLGEQVKGGQHLHSPHTGARLNSHGMRRRRNGRNDRMGLRKKKTFSTFLVFFISFVIIQPVEHL